MELLATENAGIKEKLAKIEDEVRESKK